MEKAKQGGRRKRERKEERRGGGGKLCFPHNTFSITCHLQRRPHACLHTHTPACLPAGRQATVGPSNNFLLPAVYVFLHLPPGEQHVSMGILPGWAFSSYSGFEHPQQLVSVPWDTGGGTGNGLTDRDRDRRRQTRRQEKERILWLPSQVTLPNPSTLPCACILPVPLHHGTLFPLYCPSRFPFAYHPPPPYLPTCASLPPYSQGHFTSGSTYSLCFLY